MICLGNGDLWTKDPTKLAIGSGSELSADNPKKDCTRSHRRFEDTIVRFRTCDGSEFLKLSDGITLANRMRVPLDSPPSNTSLKRKGRYISAFHARALWWRRAAFACRQILTLFATGYSY